MREGVDARELDRDVLVIAAGAASAELWPELPVRPLCRQLVEVGPVAGPARRPADGARGGDRVPLPPRGRHAPARDVRADRALDGPEEVDEALVEDWRARVAHRYPAAAGAPVARAWAGLYDMTPDAHPIIGWVGDGVYAACGFSGHGFMQSPAVGRAVAEELLGGESSFDLSPYRLERFEEGAVFPEELVL